MAFGKPTFGPCKGPCRRTNVLIEHKSKGLCGQCNWKRKQEARRASSGKPGREKALLLKLYEHHKQRGTWRSMISGEPLPDKPADDADRFTRQQFFSCFSHVLSQSRYPETKLDVRAIFLVTPDEHRTWEWERHKIYGTTGSVRKNWQRKLDAAEQIQREIERGAYEPITL